MFAKLPEEAKAEAISSRANLYNWLVDLDQRVNSIPKNVSDAHVTTVASMLMLNGIEKPEDATKLAKDILEAVFKMSFIESRLVSRQGPSFPWEQTGFHKDGAVQTVFAKVGKAPYQPVGHDDGTHYVPREVSNLLWRRQWGMSLVIPFKGPFACVEGADDPTAYAPARLSAREISVINEGIEAINEELDGLKKANSDTKGEAEFRLRETIKLARLQLPKLDFRMNAESDKRPELGPNFENVDAFALGGVVLEYMALQLDEHAAREGVAKTTLMNRDAVQVTKELKVALHSELSKLLSGVIDEDSLASCVVKACVSLPDARVFLDSFGEALGVVDQAKKLVEFLGR